MHMKTGLTVEAGACNNNAVNVLRRWHMPFSTPVLHHSYVWKSPGDLQRDRQDAECRREEKADVRIFLYFIIKAEKNPWVLCVAEKTVAGL